MCNKGFNSAAKAEMNIQNTTRYMRALAEKLYTLAPHPKSPNTFGAQFIALDPSLKPAAEYDGILANIALESFIGTAFSSMASDSMTGIVFQTLENIPLDSAADITSEYLEYYDDKKRGQGTYAFDAPATSNPDFTFEYCDEYFDDLDERLEIEETLSHLSRELSALQYMQTLHVPALAAA